MISRETVLRLGSILADDFGRSWSIGIWFVLSFAAVGYATQTSLGFSFQYAVLAAFLSAAAVASAKTLVVQRESHEDTEGGLFRQLTSDLVDVLGEHSELLRKQQESSLIQVQLLASLNEHLTAASLSTPSSASQELIAAIARVQAATEQSRDMSEHFMQHLIRIFSEGQQTLQKLSEQITALLESVVQHPDSSASSPPEKQTEFTVVLTAAGTNKINVIKAVREVTSLGLKEAKDLVDSAPSAIKERVNAEEAEAIKRKFVSSGASAEVKPS